MQMRTSRQRGVFSEKAGWLCGFLAGCLKCASTRSRTLAVGGQRNSDLLDLIELNPYPNLNPNQNADLNRIWIWIWPELIGARIMLIGRRKSWHDLRGVFDAASPQNKTKPGEFRSVSLRLRPFARKPDRFKRAHLGAD